MDDIIDKLTKIQNEIGKCNLEESINTEYIARNTNTCKSAGKSDQKVYVCNNYVFKTQPDTINRRVERSSKSKYGIKVDPFTMNNIQHLTMMYIKDILLEDQEIISFNNTNELELKAESPLILCKDNNATVMIDNKVNMDFETYLLENYQDNNYLDNIITILKGIFLLQNKLYELCQFHHCDMKCAQILLKFNKNDNTKLDEIILSDFDKSTLTLNINNQLYRIRIIKTQASYGKLKYIIGGISGKLKVIDKSVGIQFHYRVIDRVLLNNEFFNYCLLSSTLLLIHYNYFNDLIKRIINEVLKEHSNFYTFNNLEFNQIINLDKIIKSRNSKESTKLKNNKQASRHVNTKKINESINILEETDKLKSEIIIDNLYNQLKKLNTKQLQNQQGGKTRRRKYRKVKKGKKLTKRNKRKNKYNRKVKSIKKHNKKIYKSKRK